MAERQAHNLRVGGSTPPGPIVKSPENNFLSSEVKKEFIMSQGKKTCPNCKKIVGGRTNLCGCAYHFPSQEIRKDLLKAKNEALTGPQIYSEKGPGRKTCPGCNIIVAAILKTCFKCGFDFAALKKERDAKLQEEKEEKLAKRELRQQKEREERQAKKELREKARKGSTEALSPQMQEMLKIKHEPMPKRSPIEHAKRILSYGAVRASLLLQQARNLRIWSHVDWNYVEARL